jgi:hypothetical protein
MTTEKLTFTVEEAGKLPTLRFGKRLVVPKKAVQDMLERAATPS